MKYPTGNCLNQTENDNIGYSMWPLNKIIIT